MRRNNYGRRRTKSDAPQASKAYGTIEADGVKTKEKRYKLGRSTRFLSMVSQLQKLSACRRIMCAGLASEICILVIISGERVLRFRFFSDVGIHKKTRCSGDQRDCWPRTQLANHDLRRTMRGGESSGSSRLFPRCCTTARGGKSRRASHARSRREGSKGSRRSKGKQTVKKRARDARRESCIDRTLPKEETAERWGFLMWLYYFFSLVKADSLKAKRRSPMPLPPSPVPLTTS
jgi:hypothetical protein